MHKALALWLSVCFAAAMLAGCDEKADIKKDSMDARSLKALENPPAGMPGAPPKGKTPPGTPSNAPSASGQ